MFLDAARVYWLVREHGVTGQSYHAVAEEGVTVLAIAQSIGHGLGLPVTSVTSAAAAEHFGGLALAVGANLCATSMLTQQWLNWRPNQADGFIADFEA